MGPMISGNLVLYKGAKSHRNGFSERWGKVHNTPFLSDEVFFYDLTKFAHYVSEQIWLTY